MLKGLTIVIRALVLFGLLTTVDFVSADDEERTASMGVGNPAAAAAAQPAVPPPIQTTGQPQQTNTTNPPVRRQQYTDRPPSDQQAYVQNCMNGDTTKQDECLAKYFEIIGGSRGDVACNEARREYNEARANFSSACSTSGFRLSSDSGQFACSKHVACCVSSTTGSDTCHDESSQFPASAVDQRSTIEGQITEIMETMSNSREPSSQSRRQLSQLRLKQTYNQCPMRSRVDLDTAFEDAEEAREKLQDKEIELSELREELQQAQIQLKADIDAIQTEKEELDAEAQARLDEIEQQLEDENEQIAQRIREIEENILKVRDQVYQLEAAKGEAQQEFQNQLTEAKLACHNQALQTVREKRKNDLEMARQGQLTQDLKNVFASVGSSNFEDLQKLVDREYRRCRSDMNYQMQVKRAKSLMESAIANFNQQIQNMQEPLKMLQREITRFQTEEKSKALRNNMKALSRLQSEHERGMKRLTRKLENTQREGQAKVASLQERISIRQNHMASAEEGLAYKQAILDAKRQYAGGNQSISADDFSAATNGYSVLVGATSAFADQCCSGGERNSSCQAARAFAAEHSTFYDGSIVQQREAEPGPSQYKIDLPNSTNRAD